MNAAWGWIALVIGFSTWFSPPGWNGFWWPPSDVSVGDTRIIAAIFIAAAMIVLGLQRDDRR
jgi:hypothetical protein